MEHPAGQQEPRANTARGDNTLLVNARVERSRPREPGFVLDVELRVPPGITILFGPSGSGKTTILHAIAGLLRPQAGRVTLGDEIWFDAERGIDMPVQKRHVAYVFQSLALFPHMTAAANVAFGVTRDKNRADRLSRAHSLLDRLGVGHLAARKPRTFSGGEAQRVALARALAMSPRAMLLDEPFSALDRPLRRQLVDLVRELVDEYRLPLLHVTHDHHEALALGDHAVRIAGGRVVGQGPPADILDGDP